MNGHKITNQQGLHFITPTIVGWLDVFTRKRYKDIIVESLNFCTSNKGLNVHAYVIMSNHMHLIVSAQEEYELSNIIRDFKRHTSKKIIAEILENTKESRQVWLLKLMKYFAKYNKNNTNYQFWKRDNYPIELSSPKWIKARFDYIHLNPVRAGLVNLPEHYVYSSACDYVKNITGLVEISPLEVDYHA